VPVDGSGSVATVDAVVSGSGVVVGSGPVVAVVVVVSPSESETLPIPVVASLSPLVGGVVVELVPSDHCGSMPHSMTSLGTQPSQSHCQLSSSAVVS
jgi:hypothetical protein